MGAESIIPLKDKLKPFEVTNLGGNGSLAAITVNGARALLDSRYEDIRNEGKRLLMLGKADDSLIDTNSTDTLLGTASGC
jgi:hypothetical protein